MKAAEARGPSLKAIIAHAVYTLSRLVCLGVVKLAFRLHVEGEEHIPRTGPAILAANHVSFIDPVIIAIAIRRPICFMAKKELFRHRLFGWLLRQCGAFPVNRDQINLQAFKQAISLLKAGKIVAVFPEGTRGDGVELRPAKRGIGLIAARTGVPVIPTFHRGTEKVLPRGAWYPRPHRVTITFGAPCRFTEDQIGHEQDQIGLYSVVIMKSIAALKTSSESGTQL